MLRTKMILTTTAIGFVLLSGCARGAARYSVSVDNNVLLRNIANGHITVKVGEFTAETPQNSIMCRPTEKVVLPDNDTFDSYIKKAFLSELKLAGIYNENSKVVINGHLRKVELIDKFGFNSVGKWTIAMEFSAIGKEAFTVTKEYKYDPFFTSDVACIQAANLLVPAVQDFLNTVFADSKFQLMLQNN